MGVDYMQYNVKLKQIQHGDTMTPVTYKYTSTKEYVDAFPVGYVK